MRISTLFLSLSVVANFTFTFGCGFFEFFEWSDVPEEVMEAAMDLGFDMDTWNNVKTSPISYLSFDTIMSFVEGQMMEIETPYGTFKRGDIDILSALEALDLYDGDLDVPGECWDFFVNHYDGYTWEQLGERENPFGDNLQNLVSFLGWTEEMWDDVEKTGTVPPSDCVYWSKLTPAGKL